MGKWKEIRKWLYENIAWEVVKTATGWVLKDPPPGRPRPPVLYDPASKLTYRRQPNGTYVSDGIKKD